eukprot:TRINITY_DN26486_c0_g1_i3.p1 TRINITY_DN26486_c0_g1~~TRINITY_DN26486_c0_g1_i3.p1  ORF type:complete len:779 (+),score=139.67 TRINITY_DN26486_c0_g1_i3:84-2420(+)
MPHASASAARPQIFSHCLALVVLLVDVASSTSEPHRALVRKAREGAATEELSLMPPVLAWHGSRRAHAKVPERLPNMTLARPPPRRPGPTPSGSSGSTASGHPHRPADVLLCHHDPNLVIYEKEHMAMTAGWGNPARASTEMLQTLGYGDMPRSWYTAANVRAELISMLPMLQDLAERTGRTYWLHAGALIGALRSGSMLPWDNDVDFCLDEKPGQALRTAYNTEKVALMRGFVAQSLGGVRADWRNYMVAFNADASEVYIFSMRTGLKFEMIYGAWHCFRKDIALPVRSVAFEGLQVNVPQLPMEWLRQTDHYGCSDFWDAPSAFLMYTSSWSRCMICPSAAVADATTQTFRRQRDASKAEYFAWHLQDSNRSAAFLRRQRLNYVPKECIHHVPKAVFILPTVGAAVEQGWRCREHVELHGVLLIISCLGLVFAVGCVVQDSASSLFSVPTLLGSMVACTYPGLVAFDYITVRMVVDRHGPFGLRFNGDPHFSLLSLALLVSGGKLVVSIVLCLGRVGIAVARRSTHEELQVSQLMALSFVDVATFAMVTEIWGIVALARQGGKTHLRQARGHLLCGLGIGLGILMQQLSRLGYVSDGDALESLPPWSLSLVVLPLLTLACTWLQMQLQETCDEARTTFEFQQLAVSALEMLMTGVLLAAFEPWQFRGPLQDALSIWEVNRMVKIRIVIAVATPYMVHHLGPLQRLRSLTSSGPLAVAALPQQHHPVIESLPWMTVLAFCVAGFSSIASWIRPSKVPGPDMVVDKVMLTGSAAKAAD